MFIFQGQLKVKERSGSRSTLISTWESCFKFQKGPEKNV